MDRLFALLCVLGAVACQPSIKGNYLDDTGTSDTDDSSEPDTADTGEENPCAPSGVCELNIVEATAECGESDPDRPSVSLSAASDGTVTATLAGMEVGCCPTVEAGGAVAWATRRIDLSLVTYADSCDCACPLDAVIIFTGAPTGDYAVMFNGIESAVSVP